LEKSAIFDMRFSTRIEEKFASFRFAARFGPLFSGRLLFDLLDFPRLDLCNRRDFALAQPLAGLAKRIKNQPAAPDPWRTDTLLTPALQSDFGSFQLARHFGRAEHFVEQTELPKLALPLALLLEGGNVRLNPIHGLDLLYGD
jgi:hypothetical protein